MKKIIFLSICCIICLCGCTTKKADFNYKNEEQIEKDITANLEAIMEVTNKTSSNPYDYTKNEYYKNIINLGNNAANVIESMYKNGKLTGLNVYLAALAIQDITKCNLSDEYNWSTAEEFFALLKERNCL